MQSEEDLIGEGTLSDLIRNNIKGMSSNSKRRGKQDDGEPASIHRVAEELAVSYQYLYRCLNENQISATLAIRITEMKGSLITYDMIRPFIRMNEPQS